MPKPHRRSRKRTPFRRFLTGMIPGLLLLLVWWAGGLVRNASWVLFWGAICILPAIGYSQSGRGPLRGAVTGAAMAAGTGLLLSVFGSLYPGAGLRVSFLQTMGLVPLGFGVGMLAGLAGDGPRRRGRRLGWTGMDALFLPVAWILLLGLWNMGLGTLWPSLRATPIMTTPLQAVLGPLTLAVLLWRLLQRRGAGKAFLSSYRPGLVAAIGGVCGGIVVMVMEGAVMQWSPHWLAQTRNPLLLMPALRQQSIPLLVTVLGVGLLSPMVEEAYFRGFLYPAWARRYGKTTAVLGSAALYALFHGQAGLFLPLFVGGLILASLYERTGSLWAPTIAHATVNLLGVMAAFLAPR